MKNYQELTKNYQKMVKKWSKKGSKKGSKNDQKKWNLSKSQNHLKYDCFSKKYEKTQKKWKKGHRDTGFPKIVKINQRFYWVFEEILWLFQKSHIFDTILTLFLWCLLVVEIIISSLKNVKIYLRVSSVVHTLWFSFSISNLWRHEMYIIFLFCWNFISIFDLWIMKKW